LEKVYIQLSQQIYEILVFSELASALYVDVRAAAVAGAAALLFC
jgi:hypothetical protein